MFFVIFGTDKPGMGEVRARTRPSHRVYIRNPRVAVRFVNGGPTLDEKGETMNGSLLVVEAESLDLVRTFVAEDPYSQAGLFERVEIRSVMWS